MATRRKATVVEPAEDSPANYHPSAMTHEFIPDFDLARINANPYNVRERAVADDELIESVRENGLVEPLVVAPQILEAGTGIPGRDHDLVAGHRRLDALLRIGATTAPVIIRYDLDTRAKQVETMLIENDRRQGLTPIEQAKGYKQLTLFGVSQTEVAKKVGVDRKTVAARLKLLDLNNTVQQRVNDGQVTIDDAIAIAALPATEQTKVAKVAGSYGFKYELESAQRRVKKTAEIDERIKELQAAGVPERTYPPGKTAWNVNDADDGMVRLGATFSSNLDDHDGCLAWVKVTGPDLEFVCTNVAAHDEQLSEKQRQAREEAERDAAEQKARDEAEEIAQRLRTDAILESIRPGVKLDPAVDRLLRVTLRSVLFELGWHTRGYFAALETPADEQWGQYSSQWKPEDVTRFERHLAASTMPADVLRLLAAATVATVEGKYFGYVGDRGPRSPYGEQAEKIAMAHLEVAQAAGHELTPIEQELLDPVTDDADGGES